jgi:hypothetical protein
MSGSHVAEYIDDFARFAAGFEVLPGSQSWEGPGWYAVYADSKRGEVSIMGGPYPSKEETPEGGGK